MPPAEGDRRWAAENYSMLFRGHPAFGGAECLSDRRVQGAGVPGHVSSRGVSQAFVGRRAELEALSSTLGAAAGGRPATVLVGAEAGGGKSRLVAEFTAQVPDGVLVLTGGCVDLGMAEPRKTAALIIAGKVYVHSQAGLGQPPGWLPWRTGAATALLGH